jgi:hypothetical protein
MLKFASLSLSQKKCVIALIEANPSLKKDGKISLKEVVAITQDLASKRASGAPKIGYPNWLFKSNKVERGLYQLPLPTEKELSDYTQSSTKPTAVKQKVAKVKTAKVKTTAKTTQDKADTALEKSRLQSIIDDSVAHDEDVEDFNAILRENGIEV